MSALPKPKPKPKRTPFNLEPGSGVQLATYSLIRAVYNNRLEQARDILAASPEQINLQEPFAGLTALHIAIFRQNEDMVALLANHPRCDLTLKDNFQRTAAGMLIYTAKPAIFDVVMRRSYPEQEREWTSLIIGDGLGSVSVISLQQPRT